MKAYNSEHKYCPKCGDNQCTTTLMAYVFYSDNPEDYKDKNQCTCVKCGDRHTRHDRLKYKQETILNNIEEECVFKFGLSENGNKIKITELCDENYRIYLTKLEALKMIQEMMAIIDKLN